MDLKALDNCITSAHEFAPTVITQERYNDWHDELQLNERECKECGNTVGWSDYDSEDSLTIYFTEYLRADEDDEVNLCEHCTHEAIWNESVR